MSKADLAAGSAVRAPMPTIKTASRGASTDSGMSAGFPELLTKMATTVGDTPPGRPEISIAEYRRMWSRDASQPMPAEQEPSDGGEPWLSLLPASGSEPALDAADRPAVAPQSTDPRQVDKTLTDSTMPFPVAVIGTALATTGACLPQASPAGKNDLTPPQASSADAGASKKILPDSPTRSIGVPEGTQDKRDYFASAPASTAGAAAPKEAPSALPAVAGAGVPAPQLVSAVAQETHIAPAVQPWLAQSVRYRGERVSATGGGAPLEQGTERASNQPLAARVDVLATEKPVRPSQEHAAPLARLASEQDATSDADVELGRLPAPTDHSVSGLATEQLRAAGVAPQPSHQVANQIVSAAAAVQREEMQPIGSPATGTSQPSVVKVLRLELQPADLGTITIRMSLKKDALDIRVEASRHDTARMLQSDQESLAKILTSAGYRIDGLSVATASTGNTAIPDASSQASLPSSTSQHWGASQHESGSSGGRPNAETDSRSHPGKRNDDNDKSRTTRGADGDLYV